MSTRKEKTVSFNEDNYSLRSDPGTTRTTMSNTSMNPWNRGYSTDNLYWGVANTDIDKVKRRLSENQSKFIQDRISQVERHFGDLCTNFGAYSRKNGSLRDKGDVLGRSILSYAENESLNHTTKAALKDFAENFAGVQDFREIQVKRLESKVLQPLSSYGHQCKMAKERLKQAFSARDKEAKKKKQLDNVKDKKPSDRHTISQAETDLHQASVDASRTSKVLEEEMDGFEKKKLQDIKHILLDFVNIELLFHAKALEMYTRCYQSLTTMSEEEDLEEFRNSLRPPSAQTRLQQMQRASGSRTSLNSMGQSAQSGGSTGPQRARSAPKPAMRSNTRDMNDTLNSTSMYSETQDDDDDDDDEDEETDEEEDSEDEDETESESVSQQQQHRQQQKKYSMFQATK